MPTLLNQLIQVLKVKISLYRELKNTLLEEKNVIGRGNISLLQKYLLKKEVLVKKLGEVDNHRKIILVKLAKEMNFPFDQISLSEIIKNATGSARDSLEQLRTQLKELIRSIERLQSFSEKLVTRASMSNSKVLGFFNRFNTDSSYSPNGSMGNVNRKSYMLSAEA